MLTQLKKGKNKEDNSNEAKPVHSLLFVKSMPTMRLEDSRPAFARASVTFQYGKENYFRISQKPMNNNRQCDAKSQHIDQTFTSSNNRNTLKLIIAQHEY